MKTIIIGDVHGCSRELASLIEETRYSPNKDRLIFVGDLLDKGPDGPACVKIARKTGAILVRGNHEWKHLRWVASQKKQDASGGKFINNVQLHAEDKAQHSRMHSEDWEYLEKSRYFYYLNDKRDMVVLHAGAEPSLDFEDQEDRVLCLCRYVKEKDGIHKMAPLEGFKKPVDSFQWYEKFDRSVTVFFGHQVFSLNDPKVVRRQVTGGQFTSYGIDTGCVYGGHLTAAVYSHTGDITGSMTPTIVQVPAYKKYKELEDGLSK
jgi:bis(5'-nucleosyl)-tetraphosphatase (symmetrical)